MLHPRALPVLFLAAALTTQSFAQAVVQGEAFGYVKLNITAGTGTSKRTTLLSLPLLDEASVTGKAAGRITGVTSNTITASGAGWAAGQLSAAATPYLLEITSGNAQGRMLLVSTTAANTSDTVTIDADEITRVGNLTSLELLAGDGSNYRIRPVDTLSSFFGTPETTLIQGGSSANTADTVTIVMNGSATTYFYNTAVTPRRWARVALGSPDSSNVPLLPHAGVQYARIANTPLEFIVTGKVPTGQRKVPIRASGTTLLAPFWPVSQTLAGLGLQNTPGWASGASPATADTLVLSSGGSVNTFFHDGTNWRRTGLGSPVSNSNVVPVGTALLINRKSGATTFGTYQQSAPYNLQ